MGNFSLKNPLYWLKSYFSSWNLVCSSNFALYVFVIQPCVYWVARFVDPPPMSMAYIKIVHTYIASQLPKHPYTWTSCSQIVVHVPCTLSFPSLQIKHIVGMRYIMSHTLYANKAHFRDGISHVKLYASIPWTCLLYIWGMPCL